MPSEARQKKLGKYQIGSLNAQFWGLKTWGQGGPGPPEPPWICQWVVNYFNYYCIKVISNANDYALKCQYFQFCEFSKKKLEQLITATNEKTIGWLNALDTAQGHGSTPRIVPLLLTRLSLSLLTTYLTINAWPIDKQRLLLVIHLN